MQHTFGRALAATVAACMSVVSIALAQSTEVVPVELPAVDGTGPAVFRADHGPDADTAIRLSKRREEFRKTFWADEAVRIAHSGQEVVRLDDALYVFINRSANFPRAIVFKNSWGAEGGIYTYQSFDKIGQFHIVEIGAVDNEGSTLLISFKTGLIFGIYGTPAYSPDKSRFFANASNGMGCIEGVSVYRIESDKLFKEADSHMGCDRQCRHEWLDSNVVKSICVNSTAPGEVEYRLTYRDGVWHQTRSPEKP